jgi:hypothetical protein
MRTWWSSRCIRSSTLAWRLCFFIPQIWLHSPNKYTACAWGQHFFFFSETSSWAIYDLLSRERLELNECRRSVTPIQCLPLDSLLLFPKSYIWIPTRSSDVSKTFVRKHMERELCSFWKR